MICSHLGIIMKASNQKGRKMGPDTYEIERKYLIRYPDARLLNACESVSEIVQTYLTGGEKGYSERVRKRGGDGKYVYTHTRKKHISDVRRIEIENEISEEEYTRLLERADPERRTILKRRYCLSYRSQLFEIDVYPFWSDRAVMEIELSDEAQEISFPDSVAIIKEVTDDKRYTNASMARSVPFDEI